MFLAEESAKHAGLLLLRHCREAGEWGSLFFGHPLEDELLDWAQAEVLKCVQRRSGWVYVAANPTTHVPVVKVGQTQRHPLERISALRTAGVLGQYVLIEAFPTLDRHHVEAAVHRRLAREFEHDRELFRAPTTVVTRIVSEEVGEDARRLSWLRLNPAEMVLAA